MAEKKVTYIKSKGRIVGRDTTRSHNDGSLTTTHQTARAVWGGAGGIQAGKITGTTTHKGSESKYKKS